MIVWTREETKIKSWSRSKNRKKAHTKPKLTLERCAQVASLIASGLTILDYVLSSLKEYIFDIVIKVVLRIFGFMWAWAKNSS